LAFSSPVHLHTFSPLCISALILQYSYCLLHSIRTSPPSFSVKKNPHSSLPSSHSKSEMSHPLCLFSS
jgi:hypothetical protein